MSNLAERVRIVPDFPIKGIQFRDVQSLFEDQQSLRELRADLVGYYFDKKIDKVVGIDARGFVCGAILADRLKCGFVMARKPGKLPGDVESVEYEKEYGKDSIEISADAIKEGDVVLIHDDLLATGGTALAVYELVKKFKPSKVYFSFLIEIKDGDCNGLELLKETGEDIHCVLSL